jgi:hypothetical protein
MTYKATMVQDGKEVVLKIGTSEECWLALTIVSGTPGITKLSIEREGETNERR